MGNELSYRYKHTNRNVLSQCVSDVLLDGIKLNRIDCRSSSHLLVLLQHTVISIGVCGTLC
jgi:hypothetical protein